MIIGNAVGKDAAKAGFMPALEPKFVFLKTELINSKSLAMTPPDTPSAFPSDEIVIFCTIYGCRTVENKPQPSLPKISNECDSSITSVILCSLKRCQKFLDQIQLLFLLEWHQQEQQ